MDLTGLLPWAGLAGATLAEADVVIGGIPYDGSAVYRKGAAKAPQRIRSLSPVMPPVTEGGRHLLGMAVHDLGDLDAGLEIETSWERLADTLAGIPERALLTMMGGDHCSAIPIVAAQARRHRGLHVLWVDAHPDLCDFSRGGSWTCGCALRRALEVAGLDPSAAGVAGGRDYDLEELQFMKQHGMLLIGSPEMARDPEAAARQVAKWAAGMPLHVSWDIDVLDPAAAPGTEIPSPGGLSTREGLDFLAALAGAARLVGLDVTEVAPPVDHNDITSLAALKIIFEFWGKGMEAADVVIVGGGVMGCSLAYHLARKGVDVVLLERGQLGSGSTARNAGGVRQQFSSEVNVRIGMRSVAMLKRFEEEIGVPADFRQVGYLMLLTRPQEVEDFHRLMELWHRLGLAEARWLSTTDVGGLVPALNLEDVLGATFCPTDGIASPDAVTMGYAGAARRHGARLREGAEVTSIEVSAGRVTGVRTAAGEVSTRVVFDCAGPWAKAVGLQAGVDVPVEPYRRHIWVTDNIPEIGRQTPMTVDFTTSFYFHPEGDGILFGMSDREEGPTFSTEVNEAFLGRVVDVGLHRLPPLEQAGIRTAWAGLYEVTPDHQAILGPVAGVDGFWCACGFSGHGFMQAPAVGEQLAQLLTEGSSEIDLSALSHSRFAAGTLATERNVI